MKIATQTTSCVDVPFTLMLPFALVVMFIFIFQAAHLCAAASPPRSERALDIV